MSFILKNLDRMSAAELEAIQTQATAWHAAQTSESYADHDAQKAAHP